MVARTQRSRSTAEAKALPLWFSALTRQVGRPNYKPMNRRQRLLVLAPLALAILAAGLIAAPYVSTSIDEATAPELTPSPVPSGVNSSLVAININALIASGQTNAPLAAPTRVRVPSLHIDLPVVMPKPAETFPYCDVSEFLTYFGRPGGSGITVLYAHARPGMFGPLLSTELSKGSFVGRAVLVDTADGRLYTYKIVRAYEHSLTFNMLGSAPTSDLLLQTSETDSATGTKLMLLAAQVSVAKEPGVFAPTPHPRLCH